jgi:sec-independent protein translocase protein TatA
MGDLFSGGHIILIVLVVLLLFGGKKIPELMRGLGRGIREFKDAKDHVKKEIEDNINNDQPALRDQSSSIVKNSGNTAPTRVIRENTTT